MTEKTYDRYFRTGYFRFNEAGGYLEQNYSKIDQGYQVSPWTLSTYSLYLVWKICEGSKSEDKPVQESIDLLEKQADYLLQSYPDGRLKYFFSNESFAAPADWISGMSQAAAAHFLLRAFLLTGKDKYRVGALRIVYWLSKFMSEGGVVTEGRFDQVFLEEVAHRDVKSSKVFNGHILATIHLFHFLRLFKDLKTAEDEGLYLGLVSVLRRAVHTTINAAPKFHFDRNEFFYSLEPKVKKKTGHYAQTIHVAGLIWSKRLLGSSRTQRLQYEWLKILKKDTFPPSKDRFSEILAEDRLSRAPILKARWLQMRSMGAAQ